MFQPWTSEMLEKLKILKKLAPLFAVGAMRGEKERQYDLLAITVKIIDLVIENMGMGTLGMLEAH